MEESAAVDSPPEDSEADLGEEEGEDDLNPFRLRLLLPADLRLLVARLSMDAQETGEPPPPPPPRPVPPPPVVWLGAVCDRARPLPDPAHDRNFAAYWMNQITQQAAAGNGGSRPKMGELCSERNRAESTLVPRTRSPSKKRETGSMPNAATKKNGPLAPLPLHVPLVPLPPR